MDTLVCLLTQNRCYKTGQKIKPKGVMVHSTGANNPTLKRYVQPAANDPNRADLLKLLGVNQNHNDWNRSNIDACVHGFIGKLADGSITAVQTLPWNHRGWHAGTGTSGKSANDTHISFEICEDGLADPVYFNKVYQKAVELTAMLCKTYNLDPLKDGVVICHSEGYKRGIASGHADVMHWFPKHGKNMDIFRQDVKTALTPKPTPEPEPEEEDNMTYYKYHVNIPQWYRPAVDKAIEANAIQGVGTDELGNIIYNVSEDICRMLTILDRMGKL